ncbi:MAG: 4-(cytidine 5'-diphospho)-2-C-methyl-D-erythritol kinase [Campylobacteraceae bacterium]|jgi:4-diphosphocytidyl-2-C-methyl-D-erythritol kinase|nr:4-(cytidine 5'-diphospho)-2-C-methyl-D-erythritol kinase [Campylobacteraceae bacterium]
MIKSYAKINIFLKITGWRDGYHEIISRFVRVDELYDEMEFLPKQFNAKGFELKGKFNCELRNNTIYKSYELLRSVADTKKMDDFFAEHFLSVNKKIPSGSGLGGGSSNAAAFLLYVNKTLELGLSLEKLCSIGSKIGADVNFFLHECRAANAGRIGDIIEPFDDEIPGIKLVFDDTMCDTSVVYGGFRKSQQPYADKTTAKKLAFMTSKEILQKFNNMTLNDLLRSVLICYPSLKTKADAGAFLSGSGSTFFKVKQWA